MRTGLTGLLVVAAISYAGMALAAGEEKNAEQPAAKAAMPEKPAHQEGKEQAQAPGVKLETGKSRRQDRDLRHCLDLQDNAAIAKCAGE
jgi:hypothetical protein